MRVEHTLVDRFFWRVRACPNAFDPFKHVRAWKHVSSPACACTLLVQARGVAGLSPHAVEAREGA